MKKNQDVNDDSSGYGETVDDHTPWAESTANEAMAKSIVAKTGNEASQAAGIGNTPEEMLRQIQKLSKSLVNWKQQLRQFFANALKADHEKTRNRRNRRYGLLQSGRRKKQKLKIAMCMDSSGSVDDASFAQVFSELDSIVASGDVEVICLDADCQVAAIYDYKKGMKAERKGNGGTAYSPAITKAVELGVDGIIYGGDFDCADTPENPKMPFLWLGINTKSPAPAKFGKVIYVDTPNV
jgi:predicted metal-dependent peptidase